VIPVKVAGTIKDFDVRSPFWSKWKYPARYKFTPVALRAQAPHGLFALCAMEQALADARLSPGLVSAEDTALFSCSAGSPFMMRSYLNTMHEAPDMRGSPMGVVSSISGTLNFAKLLLLAGPNSPRFTTTAKGLSVVPSVVTLPPELDVRRGLLGKGLRKSLLEEGFITRAPELKGGANGLSPGIFTDAICGKRILTEVLHPQRYVVEHVALHRCAFRWH